jgi:hypothetical protein
LNCDSFDPALAGPVLGQDDLTAAAWLFLVPPTSNGRALTIEPGPHSEHGALRRLLGARQPYGTGDPPPLMQLSTVIRQRVTSMRYAPLSQTPHFEFENESLDAVAVRGIEVLLQRRAWRGAFIEELLRILKPAGTLYLEATLRAQVHGEWMSWGAMLRIVFNLGRAGLPLRRAFRFSEAQGRPYRIAPLIGSGSVLADLKSVTSAAIRGGRVGLALGAAGGTFVERIIDSTSETRNSAKFSPIYLGSARVLRVHSGRFVIRLPRGDQATQRCQAAFKTLERLQQHRLSFGTPCPVKIGDVDNQPVFVESRLGGGGIAYQDQTALELDRISGRAIAMISELHVKTRERVNVTAKLFEDLIQGPLLSLPLAEFGPEFRSQLDEAILALRGRIVDGPMQLVMTHGDFKIANLVQDEAGNILGVVDWDRSERRGLPGMDPIHYLAFDRSLVRGEPFASAIVGATAASLTQSACNAYRQALGLGPYLWKVCGLLALTKYVAGQVDAGEKPSAEWIVTHRDAMASACNFLHETWDETGYTRWP